MSSEFRMVSVPQDCVRDAGHYSLIINAWNGLTMISTPKAEINDSLRFVPAAYKIRNCQVETVTIV